MFADFSLSKDRILLQLQGLEEYPEFEAELRKFVSTEFPIEKEEMASINEDTYDVLVGVMMDIIIGVGDDCDIDFAAEDSELDFAVVGITKIAADRAVIMVSFIDPNADDSDEDEDPESEWS